MSFSSLFSRRSAPAPLTVAQKETWERDGALILERFFTAGELQRFRSEIDRLWRERATSGTPIVVDVLEGELIGKRMKLQATPDSVRAVSHKLNDLYLESAACQALDLDPRLVDVLTALLEGEPIIINSLNFEKGSQQPLHFDTYYMPPPVPGRMVVTFICLEDFGPAAGPLAYVPGSHKIPPYRFSNGGIAAIAAEMPAATAYAHQEIAARGLETRTFCGHAGDVFIWHAQLYHGGHLISDPQLTRRSLVTHYWRAKDMPPSQVARTSTGGAYFKRDHQPVPA